MIRGTNKTTPAGCLVKINYMALFPCLYLYEFNAVGFFPTQIIMLALLELELSHLVKIAVTLTLISLVSHPHPFLTSLEKTKAEKAAQPLLRSH